MTRKVKQTCQRTKFFCQEVELTKLKDTHRKKVNSCNVEKENFQPECCNRDSSTKDSLKLKNDLEVASKKLDSLKSETIILKKTIAENDKETKQIQKANIAMSFQENISTSVKNDSANADIAFAIQPSVSDSSTEDNNIVEMGKRLVQQILMKGKSLLTNLNK